VRWGEGGGGGRPSQFHLKVKKNKARHVLREQLKKLASKGVKTLLTSLSTKVKELLKAKHKGEGQPKVEAKGAGKGWD